MADVDETILEKIRKIQGYLKSDNPNEAAVAAAKLTEMLMKHNIDLSDIPENARPTDPWVNVATDADNKSLAEWRITLAIAIAKGNLCKVVISGSHLQWLGRQSNIEVAQFIYETCARDLQMMADGLWYAIKLALKDTGETTVHGRTWKRQFLDGAAVGVSQKLADEVKRWRSENANMNALITTNDKELQNYVTSQYPRLGFHSGRTSMGGNAYGLGVQAGRNISFKTGVGHGGSNGPRRIGSGN